MKEIGYPVHYLEFLCTLYLGPGDTSENMPLYLGYLHHADQVNEGGGLASEHEDIQLIKGSLLPA